MRCVKDLRAEVCALGGKLLNRERQRLDGTLAGLCSSRERTNPHASAGGIAVNDPLLGDMRMILLACCCCSKLPQIYYLTVLEVRSSEWVSLG